ncbi:serine/threonine kinase [Nostoc carneum NIES-2107]|nr:serine/threonine kinase [Nostoc carneum NIES-2107]
MLLNNRYEVLQTLGGGGFGETFLAEDTQMPSKRHCVIKQLKPIQNNPQIYQLVQERFQREAAILENLGSQTDQIPTLYAYFELVGQFYLVQELIEGQTLTAKLQQQGLFSESAVREILVNILPVLEYIHSQGIIHRDIKPDNIILRVRDYKPVLIDFGAVRETMGTALNSQGLPTSSIVIGTPGYMSSEQAMGRPVFASDLYSLGMTAIYLLSGKQPQELKTDPRTEEITWSYHTLSVSPKFKAVIDKAIAYHPRDRYGSAREMLQALQMGANNFSPTVPYVHQPIVNPPPVTPQNTIPISPGLSSYPTNTNNEKKPIFLVLLIVCSLIGVTAIAVNLPSKLFIKPPTFPTSQPLYRGWIRLGAVNNTLGTATVGEPLIKTSQPVTIYPSVVPKVGTQVTVINGVNIRQNRPQKPDYQLAEQIGVLATGQKVVILNLDYFIDPTSSYQKTVVWAEVGLQN